VNAPTSPLALAQGLGRFDEAVAAAFAGAGATRHVRDRLIERVHAGGFDRMLLRSGANLPELPVAVERRAAVNSIDFAFEPLVLPGLSVAQATAYLRAVETSLSQVEAEGLDAPGPLWIDTLHHACVFSVLFQLAAHLRRRRGCDRIVLLHQGVRPEPRLDLCANLLARVHGIELVRLKLRPGWFPALARLLGPGSAVFYLTDMPRETLAPAARVRRGGMSRLELDAGGGTLRSVETVSGSAAFARRLGASHLALDYPGPGRVRIAPHDAARPARCPIEDWVFWPVLTAGATDRGVA